MEGWTFRTPAKVNLLLGVLGKRPDGYHEILTVMQMVDLWDEIHLEPAEAIQVHCDREGVPRTPDNLAWKAAERIRREAGVEAGVRITLIKGIPVAAGLGGGSSDAAAVLYGINRMWELGYSRERLMAMGADLGSDIPFFFSGPAALAWGRGDEVLPIHPLETPWLVLVNPGFPVSTAWAYGEVRPAGPPGHGGPGTSGPVFTFGLTNIPAHIKISPHPALQIRDDALGVSPWNDLTEGVVRGYPEVLRMMEALKACDPEAVVMSGSGPTVIGIFAAYGAACAAAGAMERRGWRSWAVQGLNRSPYW